MGATILNATPTSFFLGTDDQSGSIVTPTEKPLPQHLPKFYLFAKRGPTTPQVLDVSDLLVAYHADTFNKLMPWYNNAQLYIEHIIGQGNAIVSQRIAPSDAGTATLVLGIEYKSASDFYYQREADGSISRDVLGDKIVTTDPLDVYMIRHVKLVVSDIEKGTDLLFTEGTEAGWTFVPIMHYKAAAPGADYDNTGIRLKSVGPNSFNQDVANTERAITYNLSVMNRVDPYTSAKVVSTLYGEESVDVSLKTGAINPNTGASIAIGDIIPSEWYNTEDQLLPLRFDDFEDVHIYYDNIKTLVDMFMAREKAEVTALNLDWFDYSSYDQTVLAAESQLLDILSCTSSKGIPYFTLRLDESVDIDSGTLTYGAPEGSAGIDIGTSPITIDTGSITYASYIDYTSGSPVFMGGGSDGTLSEASFETAFIAEMAKYNDETSSVMDMAKNPETFMYDIGYNMDAKTALANFIAKRRNTYVMFTTVKGGAAHNKFVASEDLSDMAATAAAIESIIKFMPESEYFGTSVMRGCIVAGDYMIENFSKTLRVPLLIDIASKFAAYMGASNYRWNSRYRFDTAPGSIIETGKFVNPSMIPETTKQTLWKGNIVYAQPFDLKRYFFPAIQSVYSDDSSVLNSALTATAICTLNSIAYRAWKNYTGSIHLTNSELADVVVAYVNNEVNGIFDNMYKIVPEVSYTKRDLERGYSWTLVIKIYANNMKTVMTTYVEAHRMDS